jgi:HK97 gp10 family phage protein
MALDTELVWYGDKKKKDINSGTIIALTRASNLVQTHAKLIITANKNVDTGYLRSSIVKAVDKKDLTATVSTNVEYSKYIEFGTGRFAEGGGGRTTPWRFFSERYGWITTSGHKPYPFMRPALNDNKKNILKIFISEEEKAVVK